MPQSYTPEFKKKIVRLHEEECVVLIIMESHLRKKYVLQKNYT